MISGKLNSDASFARINMGVPCTCVSVFLGTSATGEVGGEGGWSDTKPMLVALFLRKLETGIWMQVRGGGGAGPL